MSSTSLEAFNQKTMATCQGYYKRNFWGGVGGGGAYREVKTSKVFNWKFPCVSIYTINLK